MLTAGGAGALAAPRARADPARRVPAGRPAQRAAARAGPLGAAHGRAPRPPTWPAADGDRPPPVAVNLAGLLPGDADFAAEVRDAVVGGGLAVGPAGARAGRDQPGRAPAARAGRDGRASPNGRPVRGRRLRHRLLLAGAAQGAARADRQGRPRVRHRDRRRPGGLRRGPRGRRHGARDGRRHAWPRASRRPSSSTCCAASASTPTRAGCSPGRWRPSRSAALLATGRLETPAARA